MREMMTPKERWLAVFKRATPDRLPMDYCKGMGRAELKRDFGDQVIFHGGMDNQQTLPFGTVAAVEREVIENIELLGKGGGYILAPCHNIQVVSPAENIVAMYRTGYQHGWQ